jgi:hypothetical protein
MELNRQNEQAEKQAAVVHGRAVFVSRDGAPAESYHAAVNQSGDRTRPSAREKKEWEGF